MIASVSKLFAGAAVLKLVSQGIINLDDDICDTVPDSYDDSSCTNPLWPDTPVTWRMLVTHRSSLRNNIPSVNGKDASYGPSGGYGGSAAGNPTCPLTDVIGFYRDFMINKPTETSVGSGINVDWYSTATQAGGAWESFEPGSQSLYSNFASGYIAALVELASGKSFPDYCRDNIFAPLGMQETAWFRNGLPDNVLETLPVEYWGGNNPFEHIDHYCFIDYASGSLRTSARDMAKFLGSMLDYGSPTLWSTALGQTAVRCAEGGNGNNCEFGVNWILMNKSSAENWMDPVLSLDWTDAAMHDGAEFGSQTQIVLFPAAGVYAIVFTNTDGNDEMAAEKLMKEVLSKAPAVDPPSPVSSPTTAPVAPPTTAPVAPPTSSCTDSIEGFSAVKPGDNGWTKVKTCDGWVSRKSTAWRCKNVGGVKEACPKTCLNCCTDTEEPFNLLSNGKSKTCTWAKTNTNIRCRRPPTRQLCAVTCGECN